MKDYRNLKVWEKGHLVTLQIYEKTKSFPKEELYGLTSQIRRSSMSVPANIAEGCGKNSEADFARFLQIALGSSHETEYFLLLAKDLKYICESDFMELSKSVGEVKSMLIGLIKKVRINQL